MALLLFFVSTIQAFAQGQDTAMLSKSELSLKPDRSFYRTLWSVELEGGRKEDSLANQSSEVSTSLKLDFTSRFSEEFSLNLAPTVRYKTGYYQSVDANSSAQSSIELRNASFDFKPIEDIQISAGSLNQQKLHNSLMFFEKSFPAVRAMYLSDRTAANRFTIFAEGAIPSSVASTNNSYDYEKAPSLMMVGFGYEAGQLEQTAFQLQANTFSFQGLSSQVANASILLGNSGAAMNSTDYRFTNQYQGFDGTIALRYQFDSRSSLGGLASFIQNSQAKRGSNTGWKTNGFYQYQMTSKWQIAPSLTYFRIEEDATVAVYNAWMYNTNRQGYVASLDLKFKKTLKFGFQILERNAILEKNMSQPNEKAIVLHLETEDAEI